MKERFQFGIRGQTAILDTMDIKLWPAPWPASGGSYQVCLSQNAAGQRAVGAALRTGGVDAGPADGKKS